MNSYELNDTSAIIRTKVIDDNLKDKIDNQNIVTGSDYVRRMLTITDIQSTLCSQCNGIECDGRNATEPISQTRCKPNGSPCAEIMFINRKPSEYECAAGTSFSDEKGVFLSLILSKINIDRGMVYMTDYIKCHNKEVTAEMLESCTNSYIDREIAAVRPKIIITNGINLLKIMNYDNIITGLPDDIQYGVIYDVLYPLGFNIKIMAMYDLEKVLQTEGEKYEKCKSELWQQLVTAIQSIGGVKWILPE